MRPERDNFKAGLFVIAGVVLALVVIFVLADLGRLLERTQEVRVFYGLGDGLQGVEEGSAVTLGDQPVGQVAAIRDVLEEGSGRVVGKLMVLEIPDRYKLAQDAHIDLRKPPLGGGTRVNIRSVGVGEPYDVNRPVSPAVLEQMAYPEPLRKQIPVGALPGGVPRNELTQDMAIELGIQELQRRQIQVLIANLETLSTSLREDVPAITRSLRSAVAKVEPLADSARQAAANLEHASGNVKALTADVRGRSGVWLGRIDSLTASADETMVGVRDLVKDKDPALRQTIDNAQAITQQIRDRNLAQVTEALDKANAALENVRAATEQVRTLVVGQRPVLERAIANAQLTTDQLKLAAIEVRRSPWRLLYKPSDKELETDNLYDAARSFALAAGTLDATAQSLNALAQKLPEGSADQQQVAEMLDHLEALFSHFEEAEDKFWDALKGRAPAK